MKRILRPLMPPWSFIILKYASSVRSIAPYAPAGPSCGPQLPTTTSVSVTPVTTGLAVALAATVAGADVAAGGGVADPQAVTSSATSNGTTVAARGRNRCCVLESCPFKSSLSFWPYPALMPQICASHLLPLTERRAPIAEDHASGLQDVRMVGDVERHVRVLLDEEHGRTGGADLADDTEDLLDQHRREAKGWLVEQEQSWPGHEGPSDGEHLLLAAAEGSGPLLQPLAQAREILEHARRILARGAEIASRVPTEQQILAHGQLGEDLPSFGHLNDTHANQAVGARSVDAPTVELDRATRRPEETGDHPQRGRLAGAVGSEQRDDAPLGDLETDAVQGADAPVVGLDDHRVAADVSRRSRGDTSAEVQYVEPIAEPHDE